MRGWFKKRKKERKRHLQQWSSKTELWYTNIHELQLLHIDSNDVIVAKDIFWTCALGLSSVITNVSAKACLMTLRPHLIFGSKCYYLAGHPTLGLDLNDFRFFLETNVPQRPRIWPSGGHSAPIVWLGWVCPGGSCCLEPTSGRKAQPLPGLPAPWSHPLCKADYVRC